MTDPVAGRQVGILARAFFRLESRRTLVAQVAGIAVVLASPWLVAGRVPTFLEGIALAAGTAAAYAGLSIGLTELLRPARVNAAYEAFLWIGRQEYLGALARTGAKRLPSDPDSMRRWLATLTPTPQNATIRIEGLVWTGDFAAARALVDGLPEWRATERFEKALNRAFVEFVATGHGPLGQAQAEAAELRGPERVRADALIAVEAARQRIAAGDADWFASLAEVRPRIGREADRLVIRDLGRRMLPGYLAIGGALSAALLALGGGLPMASL